MTLQEAIVLGLKVSIVLTVFSLGLSRYVREATYVFRNPGVLGRSLLAMDVVMPVFAVVVISLVPLPPPVKIALAALSVSPVPPLMPRKAMKSGVTSEYTIGLLVAASVVALVFVPLAVGGLGAIHGLDLHISFLTVAALMGLTILGPLLAGFIVRNNFPELAESLIKPVGTTGMILLVLCALPVIFKLWPQMMSLIGNGTLAVFVAFVAAGLAVGHFLGGPGPDERTVLAIASAMRHPGVAIAIVAANFPEQKLAIAAIGLYLIVCALASLPYVLWRKHQSVSDPHAPQTG